MEFNLKEVLKEKKISQYKLAQETLVSQSNISRICSGERHFNKLTFENAIKILKYLYSEHEIMQILRDYF